MPFESFPSTSPTPEEKRQEIKRKAYEMSRTGWNLENERLEQEILELKEPIQKILGELRPEIERGGVRVLIGDDTSGRVPTLLMRHVISTLYKEKALPAPTTLFISGTGGGAQWGEEMIRWRIIEIANKLQRYVSAGKLDASSQAKTLVVTEAVKSGASLLPLVRACQKIGISTEVVTIGKEPDKTVDELQSMYGVPVHVGMAGTPGIYRKQAFSGVVKHQQEGYMPPILASRHVDTVPTHDRERVQLWLNEIRREVRVVGDQIVAWYKGEAGA